MTAADIADLLQRLREDIPRRGQLAARMDFKRALVARIGVQAAFTAGVAEFGVQRLQALHRRPIRRLRELARSEGVEYRELWPGGTTQALPPPRVVGAGNPRPVTIQDRSAFLACLDDVLLRGRSDLLLRRGEAVVDIEGLAFDPQRANAEFDPAVLCAEADALWTMEPEGAVPRVREALMLTGARALDFGHWLIEYLPKLAVALLCGWRGGMPVLVDRTMPETVRVALAALLPADAPLHTVGHLAPLRVDRLWCMADTYYLGFYPNDLALEAVPQMLAPAHWAEVLSAFAALSADATAAPTGTTRLYLARRPARKKRLLNHAEIDAVLEGHGFARVYPEDHSLIEQLRLVRHARHIVAPEGSNGALALYGRPGVKVCSLSSPLIQGLVPGNAILEAMGGEATIFTGPVATDSADHSDDPLWSFWNDYRIDAAAFDAFLRGWLAGG